MRATLSAILGSMVLVFAVAASPGALRAQQNDSSADYSGIYDNDYYDDEDVGLYGDEVDSYDADEFDDDNYYNDEGLYSDGLYGDDSDSYGYYDDFYDDDDWYYDYHGDGWDSYDDNWYGADEDYQDDWNIDDWDWDAGEGWDDHDAYETPQYTSWGYDDADEWGLFDW